MRSFRQGLRSSITNPKVITLYVIGSLHLVAVVAGAHRARSVFPRHSYRRNMDVMTGTALVGFGAALAGE
ncbi:hypothetical protein [Williamsia sp. CHRR-6]|uniref:hypothetical protein n=1 Tax=Williamsia sp. CHRR-6 TaxID=2835871 RepID=UPI002024FB2D|nr:hypothetical protein [Williamsia sp. CHRR-6]